MKIESEKIRRRGKLASFLRGSIEAEELGRTMHADGADADSRAYAMADKPLGTKTKTCKPTRNPCCKPKEEDLVKGTQTKTCKPTRNPCCKGVGAEAEAEVKATQAKTCKPTRNPCCKAAEVPGTQTKTCKPTRNPCCKPKAEEAVQGTKAKTCKPTQNPCCKPTKDTKRACCKQATRINNPEWMGIENTQRLFL